MLNSFGGVRLNNIGVVIGILEIIGSIIFMVLMSLCIANAHALSDSIIEDLDDISNDSSNANLFYTIVIITCGVFLALSMISLLSSIMLVFGIIKERHLMLLPWLVNNGIILFFFFIFIINIFLSLIEVESTALTVLFVLLSILASVILFYTYYAIYSIYKHIQAKHDQQLPLDLPELKKV